MLGKDRLLEIYEKMFTIRKFEEKVSELFAKGFIPGFVHVYIGQEATAVGVCSALRKDDYITSTHRGHGHCIAKGADVKYMMAELFGRATGYCRGKGGSMHIADTDIGIMGANGIVGGGIPIAPGIAFAAREKGTDRVTVCFFGDGASSQGSFHESLNISAVWKLPVIYVCENNLYANTVPLIKQMNVNDVATKARAYNIPGVIVDGNNVLSVFKETEEAVKRAREGKGPTLIECKTYRWHGHYEGDPEVYRSYDEVNEWKKKDPVVLFRSHLLKETKIDSGLLEEVEKKVQQDIEEGVRFAKDSPEIPISEALTDVFA